MKTIANKKGFTLLIVLIVTALVVLSNPLAFAQHKVKEVNDLQVEIIEAGSSVLSEEEKEYITTETKNFILQDYFSIEKVYYLSMGESYAANGRVISENAFSWLRAQRPDLISDEKNANGELQINENTLLVAYSPSGEAYIYGKFAFFCGEDETCPERYETRENNMIFARENGEVDLYYMMDSLKEILETERKEDGTIIPTEKPTLQGQAPTTATPEPTEEPEAHKDKENSSEKEIPGVIWAGTGISFSLLFLIILVGIKSRKNSRR